MTIKIINVKVVPAASPPSPIDKASSFAEFYKRHFKSIIILLMTTSVICAATLITLRSVQTKNSNLNPTSTSKHPKTTVSPPSKIRQLFTKSQWGGRKDPDQEALDQPIQLVIVKHTRTTSCRDVTSCFIAMQNLQNTDIGTHHFPDIRYNFVIGGDGNIYEGRGWSVRNQQINNSIDIAFIGDFNVQVPSDWVVSGGYFLLLNGMLRGYLSMPNTRVVCHNQTEDTDSPGENLFREIVKWKYYSDEIVNGRSWIDRWS